MNECGKSAHLTLARQPRSRSEGLSTAKPSCPVCLLIPNVEAQGRTVCQALGGLEPGMLCVCVSRRGGRLALPGVTGLLGELSRSVSVVRSPVNSTGVPTPPGRDTTAMSRFVLVDAPLCPVSNLRSGSNRRHTGSDDVGCRILIWPEASNQGKVTHRANEDTATETHTQHA